MIAFDTMRNRAQILIVALGALILIAVLPFAAGLLGAVVLYVGAQPVYRRLSQRIPARLAATLIVVATAVLILLPATWLVAVVIDRTPEVLSELQRSSVVARLASLRLGEVDIGTHVIEAAGSAVSWISTQGLRVLGGAVRGTINAVLALFGLYFLLRSGPAVWQAVARYIPFSKEGADLLAHRFRQVTEATLLGTVLTAVTQGLIVALGFAATRLGDPWFWGVVTAVVSILPVFGSALVWLPGAVVLAAQGRYEAALALAALGAIVASNIDNVMRPLVNRRVSQLHPMTTLVGAFAGVGVLGLPGILLGPLAITNFFELLGLYHREYGSVSTPGATLRALVESPAPSTDRRG